MKAQPTRRPVTTGRPSALLVALAVLLLALVAGCSGGAQDGPGAGADEPTGEARFPDVVEAELTPEGDGTYTLDVTISSPYDTPERYADGWRVLAPDGTELGAMTLSHDHASEQPFTRTQSGLAIPAGVASVVVEGRDLANGYGGATVEVDVPGQS
ncbi:MAG: hypothetical protein WBQ50_18235 [Nocardioides sp.]